MPTGGTIANVSIAGPSARSGASSSAPSASSPMYDRLDHGELAAAQGSGSSSSGGNCRIRPTEVTSSGTVRVHSSHACSTSDDALPGEERARRRRPRGSRTAANSSAVTTPKLPPPPRSAQNSSGSFSWSTRRSLPVGGDELDRGDAVRRQAVLAGVPADAAAERVAGDADVGRRAVQRREAELGGARRRRRSHFAPGADARDAALGVDLDAAQLVGLDAGSRRPARRAARRCGRSAAAATCRPSLAAKSDDRDDVAARPRARRRRAGCWSTARLKACVRRPSRARRARARRRGHVVGGPGGRCRSRLRSLGAPRLKVIAIARSPRIACRGRRDSPAHPPAQVRRAALRACAPPGALARARHLLPPPRRAPAGV